MYSISEFLPADCKVNNSKFIVLLQEKWDEIHGKINVFRYKIDNLREKAVDRYLIQLNPDRCSNRRTPEHIEAICQPFNKDKFNFTKVSQEEIIMSIRDIDDSISTILVNVSPISQYHSLLCPSVNNCLPQVVTEESLNLAMKLMQIVNSRVFRIGFNSLCALASVNHLHYHLFIEKHELPVEDGKCIHINGPVFCLYEYPVPAFCFQLQQDDCTYKVANDVYKLLQYFLSKEIAHNIFMTKGKNFNGGTEEVLRVIVWPRRNSTGVKQLGAFNVAVCELSGWFPVYNADDFEKLQRSDLEAELKKWKVDDFDVLCNVIKSLFSYIDFYSF
ncbi:unnamed protein product [Diatraea saccharalis]|uniref:GDP-D-glucose phosphorylase 1 n=1 Tax=Diatraea saccharalis TaxID=40085 RepID=A0A9N9N1K2_9NEOP|nr:unnamed protein product [Diatraea saccharalis]